MTRGFTMVPNAVVCGDEFPDGCWLSLGARALYALVLHHSRGGERTCTASQLTLAEQLGVKVRTVHTWGRELEQNGLVGVERRGYARTNEITPKLLPDRKQSASLERKPAADKEDAQGEEDNSSDKGDADVEPLRREPAS